MLHLWVDTILIKHIFGYKIRTNIHRYVVIYILGFLTINALIKFVMISFLTSYFFICVQYETKEKENSSTIIKEILSDRVPPHAQPALFTMFEGWCTLKVFNISSCQIIRTRTQRLLFILFIIHTGDVHEALVGRVPHPGVDVFHKLECLCVSVDQGQTVGGGAHWQ